MNILNLLISLRDDLKSWVSLNFEILNKKIDKKNRARFSRDYHDLYNAPKITEDGKKELTIADEQGNIIFKLDKNGAHTTDLTLRGYPAATEQYVESAIAAINFPETDLTDYATEQYVDKKVADLVDSAPEALNTLGELAEAMGEHEDAYDALLETVGQKATREEVKDLEKALNNGVESEADEYCIADKDDNMIFKADKEGVETTAVKTKMLTVGEKDLATHIQDAIDAIEFPETDLSNYPTKEEVEQAIADIEFPVTDLTGYATEEFVGKAIEAIDFPEPDLSEYATEEFVKNKIAEAKLEGEEIDLSGYATKKDIKDFIKKIPEEYINEQELAEVIQQTQRELGEHTVSEGEEFQIADEEGNVIVRVNKDGVHTTNLTFGGGVAATQEFVNEAIENIQFPETDLSNYPTKEEMQQAIADIDFPETDLTDYATKEFVGEEIAKIEFPETDLTGYATEKFVTDEIGKIEFPETDLTGYATEQFVKDEVAGLVNSAPEALDTLGELAAAMKEKGDAIDALELIAGSKAAQTDLDETNQQLGAVKELVGTSSVEDQIEEALDNFETFSGDYNDLINAPDIAEDNSGDMAVADKDGNVAFKVDSEGRTHVTSLAIGGENLESILEKKATKEEITLTALGLTYGKSDLTPGVSPLPTGHFYFVYE